MYTKKAPNKKKKPKFESIKKKKKNYPKNNLISTEIHHDSCTILTSEFVQSSPLTLPVSELESMEIVCDNNENDDDDDDKPSKPEFLDFETDEVYIPKAIKPPISKRKSQPIIIRKPPKSKRVKRFTAKTPKDRSLNTMKDVVSVFEIYNC